jgi:hypothetical protein
MVYELETISQFCMVEKGYWTGYILRLGAQRCRCLGFLNQPSKSSLLLFLSLPTLNPGPVQAKHVLLYCRATPQTPSFSLLIYSLAVIVCLLLKNNS